MFTAWRRNTRGRTLVLTAFLAATMLAVNGLPRIEHAHATGPSTGGAAFMPGDLFVAIAFGQVQHRGPNGEFKHLLDNGLGSTGPDPNLNYNHNEQRMAFAQYGLLLATDLFRKTVDRFDTNGTYMGTFGGDMGLNPRAIAVDSAGNVFVAMESYGDWTGSITLKKFSPLGALLSTSTMFTDGGAIYMAFRGGDWELLYTLDNANIRRVNLCPGPHPPEYFVFATVTDECFTGISTLADGRVVAAGGCFESAYVFDGSGALTTTLPGLEGETISGAAVVGQGPNAWFGAQNGQIFRKNISTGATTAQFSDGVTGTGGHNADAVATFPGAPPPNVKSVYVPAPNEEEGMGFGSPKQNR